MKDAERKRGNAAIRRLMVAGCGLLAGCASPGRPLPPSLKLPTPVKDLRAERVGNSVELRWTTPSEATDSVPLHGVIDAELCRDAGAGTRDRCTPLRRFEVTPGSTAEVDALPPALSGEQAGVLVYRLRLMNAAGHSAGLSNAAEAPSGQAPAAIEGLHAGSAPEGVRLVWEAASGPAAAVELVRTETGARGEKGPQTSELRGGYRAGAARGKSGAKTPSGVPGSAEPPAATGVTRLMVDAADAGADGAFDRTAQRDHSYSYAAVRVRTVTVDGKDMQLRSSPGPAAAVTVRDLMPPAVPHGLVGVADGMAVDLSWEPDAEADLAGYRVYRAEGSAEPGTSPPSAPWQLQAKVVTVPGFRDPVPHPGIYFYRVTAADGSGNESAPGPAVRVEVAAEAKP